MEFRYCTSADGTRLAYATLGDGPTLICLLGSGHGSEHAWQLPEARTMLMRLAEGRRLILLDRRGVGASQRDVDDVSDAAVASDLACVVDHLGGEPVDVWGAEPTAAVVMYVGNNPGKVRRLVLWGPQYSVDPQSVAARHALAHLIRENWALARRAMTDVLFPTGPAHMTRWFSRAMAESTASETLARLFLTQQTDPAPFYPQIRVPVLVLHRKGTQYIPIASVRNVAASIPDCRFVALEGDSYYPLFGDLSYVETIISFLDEGRSPAPAGPGQSAALHIVLFTDIEGSTALTQRLGDARAQAVIETHNAAVRAGLAGHGGNEIKHTGDGIMASFATATAAIRCAIDVQRAVAAPARSDLTVHIGLNAGEPVAVGDDLFGTSVQLARRVCDAARGPQILATNVVRELAAGKGFAFVDRGESHLKGFDHPVRLYEIPWRE